MTESPHLSVLVCCSGSYVSGMEIVELAVMRGLIERGHRVHALVNGWNDGDFIGRLGEAGIPYTEAYVGKITVRRPRWMLDTLRHLPGARRTVRRLVQAFRADRVVLCNRDSALLLAGAFRGTEVAYHAHEPLSATWTRRLSRVADRFVAVSDYIRDRLVANGLAPSRVTTVHNGIEAAPPVDQRGDPPVIGICGQIGAWKGHDDLVEALRAVAARDLPFRLRVYGRGADDYVASLQARTEAAGWADRVEWMGFVHDPEAMYRDLDLLVAPSRFDEPFGMTLVEAGIRGLPVVATRAGGMPEIVEDGETGLLVPPASPDALADALATLLLDPNRRRAMGVAGRERVRRHFLRSHMVDRFEAALVVDAEVADP